MQIKDKRKRIYHLLLATGLLAHKAALLEGYGVTSTTELTEQELDSLIAYLSQQLNGKDAPEDLRRWRSNILVMLNKIGIYVTNNDWTAVNKFLLSPKIAGKLMPAMTVAELKELHRKLKSIFAKKEVNAAEINRLTQCN